MFKRSKKPDSAKGQADTQAPRSPAERLERAREIRSAHKANAAASTHQLRPARVPLSREERRRAKARERRQEKKARQERRLAEGKTFLVGGLELSTRLLSVVVLVGVLGALLVPNLYAWWKQEQELRDITAKVEQAKQQNAQMREQLDLWSDPEFIASQARERLGYVKPGEVQYAVVDPGEEYLDKAQINAASPEGPARPWIQVVGKLIQEADEAEVGQSKAVPSQSGDQSAPSGAQSAQSQ
ncbi:FtsB family cell division protein [Schaalia turicensis]|uniref:FtsB family cell division protein n=1 Tax=Schaalia turicensis TaxID=131111 RepID=UPI00189B0BB8|nr:septum formation initiator family protein [Schaalia turicensis]